MTGLSRRKELIPLFVFLFAFALRGWGAAAGLPIIHHEGERVFIEKAIGLGPLGIKPFGVWTLPFDLHYLLGHLAGFFASYHDYQVAYQADPSNFILIGRLTGALFSAGVCVIILGMGRQLKTRWAGLGAAFLWAVSPLAVREAHLALPLNLSIFFATLFFFLLLRLRECSVSLTAFATGVSLAFTVVTSFNPLYQLIILLLIAFLFLVFEHIRSREENEEAPSFRLILSLFGGMILGLPIGCTMGLICPYCIFTVSTFGSSSALQSSPFLYYPRAALGMELMVHPILILLAGAIGLIWAVKKKDGRLLLLLIPVMVSYLVLGFCQPAHYERMLFVLPLLFLALALILELILSKGERYLIDEGTCSHAE